ncbi:unnamed protein product, partial [Nesidiocoris tenuis]
SGDLDAQCARISKTEKHPSSVQFDILISQTLIKQDSLPTYPRRCWIHQGSEKCVKTFKETNKLKKFKIGSVGLPQIAKNAKKEYLIAGKWKYWNRPKIDNWNGASEKTFSYSHLLRITSCTSFCARVVENGKLDALPRRRSVVLPAVQKTSEFRTKVCHSRCVPTKCTCWRKSRPSSNRIHGTRWNSTSKLVGFQAVVVSGGSCRVSSDCRTLETGRKLIVTKVAADRKLHIDGTDISEIKYRYIE